MTRVAAVLWNGVGRAETFTADLCRALRELGTDARVLFVTDGGPLIGRLEEAEVPHTSLGLSRGRELAKRPKAFAGALQALGPDAVILPAGFIAAAARLGGYRGKIVAALHGATVLLGPLSFRERLIRPVEAAAGFHFTDVGVAVSDFALAQITSLARHGRAVRIYNGIDLETFSPRPAAPNPVPTIGFAGRLVRGKGVDVLLRALALLRATGPLRLKIAGDGPARVELQELAETVRVGTEVDWIGWSSDMPSFWRGCDLAVMPSTESVESFGMAAVEAMACGKPVVATRNGALPEVVDDGATGRIVPPGDAQSLARALEGFIADTAVTKQMGLAARARCEERFDVRDCARAYLDVLAN